MASFHVAGPCEIHCGVGAGSTLAFLGWSEGGVRGSARPFYEDVKSDVLGPMAPSSIQQMGEEFFVSLDLRVWNENVWRAVASRANARLGAAVNPGFFPSGAIGALLPEEGLMMRLLVFKPYSQKAFFIAQGEIPAYNFPLAYLAGPDDIDPLGTRASKIRCVFRAMMLRDPITGNSTLYNEDFSGKPLAT